MDLPRVLIVSSQGDEASNIAKGMGATFVAEDKKIKYFAWDIDNKYYTARIVLCTTDILPLEMSGDEVEALILCYDPKEAKDTLETYVTVLQAVKDADIRMLACTGFADLDTRDAATEWCHIHKFELVDMELSAECSANLDDSMKQENYGIQRIIEVLHTHSWPHRELKGRYAGRISRSKEPDVGEVEGQLENIRLDPNRDPANHSLMENVLDGIMGEDNADFGELFGQLRIMKEHAASLSTSNRKAAAEQLVTAFWRAMGGDPAEIEDIDQ